MIITLEYKLKNKDKIEEFDLSPMEYFDELIEGENFEDDGIPKYNNPILYIEMGHKNIKACELEYITQIVTKSINSNKTIKKHSLETESPL